MLENIVLGFLQGIFEWLPVSSEGVITLVNLTFLKSSLAHSVEVAIFLLFGTNCFMININERIFINGIEQKAGDY